MKRIGHLTWSMCVMLASQAGSNAWAQDGGDPAKGLALAQQLCTECHAITKTQARSPNPASPRFEAIANVPGMTGTALSVALQTPHRTMPNVMLDPKQLSDVVAYILSLRQAH